MGEIVTWQVAGMDCAACERRLETVLGRLDGVGGVHADHATGRVEVSFDQARTGADTLTAVVTERIQQAGFTVTSVEATS
ncbi:Copper-ion-binding protein [Mycobacteroides abscessus subsp. abscessus]|nr:Copper-ion-binding protein [Mycobacteroides abscessus subsp. abscessus]